MKKKKNITTRTARQLSIVNCPLSIIIAALLLSACTNDTDTTHGMTSIGIGEIEIASTAIPTSTRTFPSTPFTLAITATNGTVTKTNTYASGSWAPDVTTYYLEDVLDPAYTFQATTGTPTLVTNQSTEALYHAADYIAGPVDLDIPGRKFVTPATAPLTHRHVDVVLTLTQGTGWSSSQAFSNVV